MEDTEVSKNCSTSRAGEFLRTAGLGLGYINDVYGTFPHPPTLCALGLRLQPVALIRLTRLTTWK